MIAARTAGSPHLENGPTVVTSVSPSSTSENTELLRMTSPWAVSSPPSSAASASSFSGERPASTGRSPAPASRSAISLPV